MSLSLQTETFLVLFDRFGPDKQEELVKKMLYRLSPHGLEKVCMESPNLLMLKYMKHLEQLLNNSGSQQVVMTFSIYNANGVHAFSFSLKKEDPPGGVYYKIEKDPKRMEISVDSTGLSPIHQFIVDNKDAIYNSLRYFCKKSEN